MSHTFSAVEAAKKLDIPVESIRLWEKKGLVKVHKNFRGAREFNIHDLENLRDKLNGLVTDNRYRILKADPSDFTSIDLFAGGGGTALGLSHAGFNHLLVNEADKHAAATLRHNKPEWEVVNEDVRNVNFKKFKGHVDLVEGGFPCQAFSYAGNKKGFADTRGTLFHEFARAVSEARPKVAVGENVRGLITHDGGRTLSAMLRQLQSIGYRVAWKLVRAQFLDVPQKRERLIIVAVRDDLDMPLLFPKERDYIITLREGIKDVPEGLGHKYTSQKMKIMDQIPEGGNWRNLPDELQREYMKASYFTSGGRTGMARRLAWNEPSLTLTCSPSQKQTERCHPEHTRPLNVREYARIQTFPDSWEFQGGITQAYKQIGNAVPVNVGFHVGSSVRTMLEGKGAEGFEMVDPLPLI